MSLSETCNHRYPGIQVSTCIQHFITTPNFMPTFQTAIFPCRGVCHHCQDNVQWALRAWVGRLAMAAMVCEDHTDQDQVDSSWNQQLRLRFPAFSLGGSWVFWSLWSLQRPPRFSGEVWVWDSRLLVGKEHAMRCTDVASCGLALHKIESLGDVQWMSKVHQITYGFIMVYIHMWIWSGDILMARY